MTGILATALGLIAGSLALWRALTREATRTRRLLVAATVIVVAGLPLGTVLALAVFQGVLSNQALMLTVTAGAVTAAGLALTAVLTAAGRPRPTTIVIAALLCLPAAALATSHARDGIRRVQGHVQGAATARAELTRDRHAAYIRPAGGIPSEVLHGVPQRGHEPAPRLSPLATGGGSTVPARGGAPGRILALSITLCFDATEAHTGAAVGAVLTAHGAPSLSLTAPLTADGPMTEAATPEAGAVSCAEFVLPETTLARLRTDQDGSFPDVDIDHITVTSGTQWWSYPVTLTFGDR